MTQTDTNSYKVEPVTEYGLRGMVCSHLHQDHVLHFKARRFLKITHKFDESCLSTPSLSHDDHWNTTSKTKITILVTQLHTHTIIKHFPYNSVNMYAQWALPMHQKQCQ